MVEGEVPAPLFTGGDVNVTARVYADPNLDPTLWSTEGNGLNVMEVEMTQGDSWVTMVLYRSDGETELFDPLIEEQTECTSP